MSKRESHDFLILGSGESGKYLAWTMAKAGHHVAVIERRWIGGSCPNIACLPSKRHLQIGDVWRGAIVWRQDRTANVEIRVGDPWANRAPVELDLTFYREAVGESTRPLQQRLRTSQ